MFGKVSSGDISEGKSSTGLSAIVFYETEDQVPKVEVRMEGETVWLTNLQLYQLFEVAKSTISEHIKNIYGSGELKATWPLSYRGKVARHEYKGSTRLPA